MCSFRCPRLRFLLVSNRCAQMIRLVFLPLWTSPSIRLAIQAATGKGLSFVSPCHVCMAHGKPQFNQDHQLRASGPFVLPTGLTAHNASGYVKD